MNSSEKKSLWSFITIYTVSSLLLMSIIGVLYFNKEVDAHKKACKKDLQETILAVELDLLKSKLAGKKFIFKPKEYTLQVGLYSQNGEKIASNLSYDDVNFKAPMSIKKRRIHKIKRLKSSIHEISYIVAEDTRMSKNLENLKYLIYLTMFISSIFIAFIGYLLSKLLLRPVHEKIAQIDHFIKDSAHEINTPVTALLMSVSALKKKGLAESKLLRHISISSKQISDIYNTLSHVAFSDISTKNKVLKFDFKKEIIKSIAFYKEIASAKNITLIDNLETTYVKMDKDSADKLVNNLLSNAIKYSYQGQKVTITLKKNLLTIQDEGMGISEQNKQEILKRYKRGTNQIGGFGIGLDIVNSICQEYEISLEIESVIGNGSTFTLDLTSVLT